jgi:hypothetical protein
VAELKDGIGRHDAAAVLRPMLTVPHWWRLPATCRPTWNAPGTDARTKQRITHFLIREIVLDRDDATNEALVTIHWNGGAPAS